MNPTPKHAAAEDFAAGGLRMSRSARCRLAVLHDLVSWTFAASVLVVSEENYLRHPEAEIIRAVRIPVSAECNSPAWMTVHAFRIQPGRSPQ